MSVYITTYEIIDDGEPLKTFRADTDSARAAHWAFVNLVGGEGFRPDHGGGLRSVYFMADKVPPCWRKGGRDSKGRCECVPHKGSKGGKFLAEQINALPCAPRVERLAAAYGYNPDEMAMDMDRGVIYFPALLTVDHPQSRTFLRLPRFPEDGFTPDEERLRAVPESELMQAIEVHNAEARRLREQVPA